MKRSLRLNLLTLVAILGAGFFLAAPKAHALVGADFKPGRIIDDNVFAYTGSMSVQDIQRFLDAKVPSCDTNGTQNTTRWNSSANRYYTRAEWGALSGSPAPFICLKNYQENPVTKENNLGGTTPSGAKSAAQIIWDAGQLNNINPQVLIVLLQKEQSLITDDWPWVTQYRSATGFGCPDTAPCDAQYYGFYNQVSTAARFFRGYIKGSQGDPDWQWVPYKTGNRFIQYNPQASCSGQTITIENASTAALYNYTPYIPNTAALNNLYGTGDSCSAYGNRNFWRMFNDWFGPTVVGYLSSPVYKGENGTQLWAVWAGTKYYIPNYDVMIAWGFHRFSPVIVPDSYLSQMTTGPDLTNIVKNADDPNSPLYLMDDGKRYPISIGDCQKDPNGNVLPSTTWGIDCFNSNVAHTFAGVLVNSYTVGDIPLPPMIAFQGSVWKLEGGKKRRIVDPLIIDVIGGWGRVRWMKDLNASQPQGKIVMRNGYLVRFSGSPVVYLYDNGQLNIVPSPAIMIAWGLHKIPLIDFDNAINVPDPLPVGPSLTQIGQEAGTAKYFLIDNGFKMHIKDSAQWPVGSPTATAQTTLAWLPEIPLSNVYKSDTGIIYTVFGAKKYVFATLDDYLNLGFNPNVIRRVSMNAENLPGLGYGGMHLANGRLYKVSNNPNQIYLVNGSGSMYVNSINYPGLPYSKLITTDPTTASRYPTNGTYTP